MNQAVRIALNASIGAADRGTHTPRMVADVRALDDVYTGTSYTPSPSMPALKYARKPEEAQGPDLDARLAAAGAPRGGGGRRR